MTTINYPSVGDIAELRTKGHFSQIFGSFLVPDTLWAMVITGSPARGDTTIDFNSGAGSNFGTIAADMPIWVGTSPGSKNVGVLRVRNITSGDGGVTGTLTAAAHVFTVTAGMYLTAKNDHPLFPKYPDIEIVDPDELEASQFRKDYDIPYTNQNENISPVVIAGSHRANFIDSITGYWQVNSQLPDSYAIAPGATIANYTASCVPSTGVTISINAGTGVGYIRFATPGQYWVKYTVTDSNGTTQSSYRFYYAHSTDPTNPHYPTVNFDINNVTGNWSSGGWTASLNFHDKAQIDMPDETLAIIWSIDNYNSAGEITLLPDNANNLITGYLRQETITDTLATGIERVTHTLSTINDLLTNHYMFSISLEAKNVAPQYWYEYVNQLTNGRAAHHVWKWHSTLLEICDVIGLTDNTDLRAYAEFESGTLYSMVDDMLLNNGIRTHVVCDQGGRIWLTPDIQLLTDSERNTLPTVFDLTNMDESGDVTITRKPQYSTVLTKVSGFYWDGSFTTTETDECPEPPCPDPDPLCASAPTDLPADDGPTVTSHDRQTLKSQAHCNELAGRYFAKENNEYPEFSITTHGNYHGVFDVAYPVFWTTSLTTERFTWTTQKLICRNISLTINTQLGTIRTQVTLEPDAPGEPGVAGYCIDEMPSDDGGDPDVTPVGGGGGVGGRYALVTGASVHYGPGNWQLRTPEDVYDLIQDPFWRAKQNSTDPLDSILIRCGVGYIKYSNDSGITWHTVTPAADPPNNLSDTPAPTNIDVTYKFIEPNYLAVDQFVFLVYWANGSGKYRTWLLKTDDFFSSFTWLGIGTGTAPSAPGLTMTNADDYNSLNLGRSSAVQINDSEYAMTFQGGGSTVTGVVYDYDNATDILTKTDVENVTWNNTNHDLRVASTNGFFAVRQYTGSNQPLDIRMASVTGGVLIWEASGTIATRKVSPDPLLRGCKGGAIADVLIAYMATDVVTGDPAIAVQGLTRIGTNIITTGEYYPLISTAGSYFLIEIEKISSYHYVITYVDEFNQVCASILDGSTMLLTDTVVLDTTPAFPTPINFTQVEKMIAVPDTNTVAMLYGADSGGGVYRLYMHTYELASANNFGISLDKVSVHTSGLVENNYGIAAENANNIIVMVNGAIYLVNGATSTYLGPLGIELIPYAGSAGDTFSSVYYTGGNRRFVTNLKDIATNHDWFASFEIAGGAGYEDEVYPMGCVFDKYDGTTFWLTYWINGEFRLANYDYATFTENSVVTIANGIALGSVLVDTYGAWPQTGFNGDLADVYVFGYWNSIQLSTTVHIVSFTGGTTWTNLAGSWGTDLCGSMIVDVDGNYFAIRNQAIPVCYYNVNPVSTLNFITGTRPHGLKQGWYGELYATCRSPNAIMVSRSNAPYTYWADITTNHDTSDGIWAIEVL